MAYLTGQMVVQSLGLGCGLRIASPSLLLHFSTKVGLRLETRPIMPAIDGAWLIVERRMLEFTADTADKTLLSDLGLVKRSSA